MTLYPSFTIREQVMEMGSTEKDKIIETISSSPGALEADDIEDFCSLAQYYASKHLSLSGG